MSLKKTPGSAEQITRMSALPECTNGHPEIKADLALLRRLTTTIRGQYFNGELLVHLRNCKLCLSTLSIEPGEHPELDAEAGIRPCTDSGPTAPSETA